MQRELLAEAEQHRQVVGRGVPSSRIVWLFGWSLFAIPAVGRLSELSVAAHRTTAVLARSAAVIEKAVPPARP